MLNSRFAQQFIFATLGLASAVGLGAASLQHDSLFSGFFAFMVGVILFLGVKLDLID